jgi:hypothetical protein
MRGTNIFGTIAKSLYESNAGRINWCPSAPEEGFWFDGKWYWVPAVVCRKCQWHRAAGRTFRFPRCTFKKPEPRGDVARATLVQLDGMIQKATEEAEQILKGN